MGFTALNEITGFLLYYIYFLYISLKGLKTMATKRVPTTVSLYDGDKESLEEIVLNLGIKSISDLLRKIALGELIVVHADSADVPITPKNQQDATKLLIVESLLESALKAIKS